MRRHLFTLLRFVVALAGIGYIVAVIDWRDHTAADGHVVQGVLTMLRRARYDLLTLAATMILAIYPLLVTRWWLLLRARGMPVAMYKAFRLVMVGNFFNFCMPGTTGGDVIKAYYAAKGSHRKTDAVISVVVDRVVGLMGLVVIGAVASLWMLHHPAGRLVAGITWGGSAAGMAVACVYFSGRMRRWLRLGGWLARLPGGHMLAQIDTATVAYRHHIPALLVSLVLACLLHLLLATSTAISGYALGMSQPLGLLLTVIPILFLGAAVPISYQGLGIMEAIALPLLVAPGVCTENQVIGMLLLARFYQIVFSLVGAAFLLQGDIRLHPDLAEPAAGAEPDPSIHEPA